MKLNKKGSNKGFKKLLILLLFFLGLSLGLYFLFLYLTKPANPKAKTAKIFVIKKGEPLTSVAKRLEKEGIIRSRIAFVLAVKKLGIERKIQAGTYRLSPTKDAFEIAKSLTKGTLDVWVTIIEGLRKEEIAQIISKELGIPEIEFLKYAKDKEGYLFPDTYLFPKNVTASRVVKIMLDNFNRRVSPQLRRKAKEKGLTVEEVIILASMVEREAKYPEDRVLAASVLLKRLKNDWPLQVDATVQYALGYDEKERTWWKKNLTKKDLEIDSPYNTYKYKGLPPTPISNPGLASIKAVIEADPNTPYWYYISDKTGKLRPAKTLEEHQENIRKYLKK